ncbi:MAG: terminase small subunit [Candidatus Roizmanbacteria bacterium]
MTSIISLKRGRPTKYTKETPRRVMHYIKKCQKNSGFPTIEHLASELGLGTRTLYAWETEYSEFKHTMEILRDAQRHLLIFGGLTNKYNSRFASFLLKANHGMSDAKPLVHATQNNTFNVSPELLAEAIEITKANEEQLTETSAEA